MKQPPTPQPEPLPPIRGTDPKLEEPPLRKPPELRPEEPPEKVWPPAGRKLEAARLWNPLERWLLEEGPADEWLEEEKVWSPPGRRASAPPAASSSERAAQAAGRRSRFAGVESRGSGSRALMASVVSSENVGQDRLIVDERAGGRRESPMTAMTASHL